MICCCGANRDFWTDYKKWSLFYFPVLIIESVFGGTENKEVNQVTAN